MTFEQKVAEARNYEVALSEWLQHRFGCYVLPTYDYSGLQDNKAPKLYSVKENLVLPDLQVWHPQRGGLWVECKWKTRADLHRRTGDYVTGISQRLYEQYKRVREVTKHPVHIAFIHVNESEIRGAELTVLSSTIHHVYDGGKMGYSGMVFWDYNKLPVWGLLSELQIKHAV